MAGITMVGSAPYFYRVRVTEALLTSYPSEETVVLRFIPPVPDMDLYASEGMRPLRNRSVVFQCFEAFKAALVRPFLKNIPTFSYVLVDGAVNLRATSIHSTV